MSSRVRLPVVLWLAIAALVSRAQATTIDPLTFEEILYGADFIGVVECITAGGIVAEYDVVDAWKASDLPSPLRIRIATNYWEPQFPTVLVGERRLIAAYATRPAWTVMSTTLGGPVPLWWRDVPADLRTPLFQGCVRLPATESALRSDFGSSATSIDELRAAATEFLALSDEEQRTRVARRLARKYLIERDRSEDPEEANARLQRSIDDAPDAAGVVRVMLDPSNPDTKTQLAFVALRRMAWPEVIAVLEEMGAKDSPLGEQRHDRVVKWIRARLHPDPSTPTPTRTRRRRTPS